jgi:hypothetical protein
MSEYI